MHETLVEDFCGADYDHVFIEVLFPGKFVPEIASHLSTKALNTVIKVAFQDCVLLKYQCDRIDLLYFSILRSRMKTRLTRKKEIFFGLPALLSSSSFSIMCCKSNTAISVLPEPICTLAALSAHSSHLTDQYRGLL